MHPFVDVHTHLMTLKEPDFAAFISPIIENPASFISGSLSKDYIFTSLYDGKVSPAAAVENTLITFTESISETMELMEEDLKGRYRSSGNAARYPDLPYLRDGMLHFGNSSYDRMIICPMLIDFTHKSTSAKRTYYDVRNDDKIIPFLKDTMEAMSLFYRKNSSSIISFCPFAGINPPAHSQEYVEEFLHQYLCLNREFSRKSDGECSKAFFGIKLYPPLGTCPWPADETELRKMRTIYAFCEKNGIPVITHCDDQGFRTIDAKDAWKFTDPSSYRSVLENYPRLILDFAHVGKQYGLLNMRGSLLETINAKLKGQPADDWFYTIMKLMNEFPSVYSDISFTGCYPEFYTQLARYLDGVGENERKNIESRLMFGSDFSINLLKVESYSAYFKVFEDSPLSDEVKERMVTENPMRFLNLKSAQSVESAEKRFRLPFFRNDPATRSEK